MSRTSTSPAIPTPTTRPRSSSTPLTSARSARAAYASGEVAAHVTTTEAATWMCCGRRWGVDATYLGASYGTKLGATYAELFPERVGRIVLDGAVDVSLDNRQLGLEQAERFERRRCGPTCRTASTPPSRASSVTRSTRGSRPSTGCSPTSRSRRCRPAANRDLAIGNAFYGIVAPLYNRDYWFILSAALGSALDGQGQALLELADLYSSRGRAATPTTAPRPT